MSASATSRDGAHRRRPTRMHLIPLPPPHIRGQRRTVVVPRRSSSGWCTLRRGRRRPGRSTPRPPPGRGCPGGDHVARRQWDAQIQARDRLDGVEHLDLMAVGGVDDQGVDSGLDQCAGLAGTSPLIPTAAAIRRPPRGRRRGVDAGADGTGARQHPAEGAVRRRQHGFTPIGACSSIRNTRCGSVHRGGDEVGGRDITHPGEPVHARGGGLVTSPTGRPRRRRPPPRRGRVCGSGRPRRIPSPRA